VPETLNLVDIYDLLLLLLCREGWPPLIKLLWVLPVLCRGLLLALVRRLLGSSALAGASWPGITAFMARSYADAAAALVLLGDDMRLLLLLLLVMLSAVSMLHPGSVLVRS
jgi:hypothetical protein